jgi:putative DNA primase/helicase
MPAETDDELFQRLANLTPAEYDRVRDDEVKRAGGIRLATLDSEVAKRRPKSGENLQGGALSLANVEPWPEAVNGADVLDEAAMTFSKFVALPVGAADALALWVAHAHAFASFICSPRLNVSSPEKGCGKTTLRDVVAVMVPRPLLTENLSVAVLFRVIEAHKPTILADECDSWLRDNEELRGMLNSGHRRGGQALRCVG